MYPSGQGAAHPRTNLLLLLVATAIVLSLLGGFMAGADARSSAKGVTAKVTASPNQVQETQNTTLTVIVKNIGNTTLRAFNATLVIPGGWSQSLHKPPVLGSVATNLGKGGSGNYSLGTLALNQTFILRVDVEVTPGTQAGNYTIFLITNPESPGVAQVSASVALHVVGPSALPLGSAAIPVSLVLILLPGFVTLMLVVWVIGLNLDVTWQTGLAVTLIAFFAGFMEWYWAGYLVARNSNLVGTILNLDIFTISHWEEAVVTGLAVGIGIGGGFVVLALNVSKRKLEDWFGLLTQGYIHNNEKVWKDLLNSTFENAVRQHGGGWAPVVSITTTDDVSYPGKADKARPNPKGQHEDVPHVTLVETMTTTRSSKDDEERKESPAKSTTVEKKDETTETRSQTTDRAPPSAPKVFQVAGLLNSFDGVDPFDIVIGPQYEIELKPGSKGFRELSGKINYPVMVEVTRRFFHRGRKELRQDWVGWDKDSLDDAEKWGMDIRHKWERAVRESRYHRNFPDRMAKLVRNLEESETVRLTAESEESEGTVEEVAPEGQPVQEEGRKAGARLIGLPGAVFPAGKAESAPKDFVSARKWIKRAEILAVDVFAPRPLYVFHLAKGKDAPS